MVLNSENKPYNGYFKVGDNDIFWVELYKNGEKTNSNGRYKIYKDGKITKEEEKSLWAFQNTVQEYFNNQ